MEIPNATMLAKALAKVSEVGGIESAFDLLGHPRTDAEREWAANSLSGAVWMMLLAQQEQEAPK